MDFVIAFHCDFVLLRRQRKGSLMSLRMRKHDGVFPPSAELPQAGLKKKKKALFTREDGLRRGGPACQAFHGTQWTHYYDSYKAG